MNCCIDVKDVIGIHIEAMAPQEINKLLQPRHPVAMMMELSRIKPTVSLMNRKFGHTALTWATLHGRSESVEALLYNGAQASEKTTRGSPALCIAAKNVSTNFLYDRWLVKETEIFFQCFYSICRFCLDFLKKIVLLN